MAGFIAGFDSDTPESIRQMAREYQGRRDLVLERLRGLPGVEPLPPWPERLVSYVRGLPVRSAKT